ncbi:hypothetical protein D918_02632 [Trichuris suis]|nr:hypothetical protein D918_02632 [Trichuris suis]
MSKTLTSNCPAPVRDWSLETRSNPVNRIDPEVHQSGEVLPRNQFYPFVKMEESSHIEEIVYLVKRICAAY